MYAFEPVPPGLDPAAARHVLGGEVPLWSENITSPANLELMAFPRLLAFAEVMWSSGPRDTASLRQRLDDDQLPRLRAMGVAVGPADRDLMRLDVAFDTAVRAPRIDFEAGEKAIVLRASADGNPPTASSPVVVGSALLPGPGTWRLQPFFGNATILNARVVTVERHHAVGAQVTLAVQPDRRYRGTGAHNLTDGMLGSRDHADGLWQGWLGPDVDAVVDLDSVQAVHSVRIDFLQNIHSWIVLPGQVEFSWSADRVHWSPVAVARHDVPVQREGAIIRPFADSLPAGTRARFIRVVGRNAGPLPAGHPGAGTPSWLFADEIVVW